MSISSSTRQVHTVLGGGIRYETAELVLSTIPNFELKQKGRILHLFTEIQEALDERQNNIDSLLAHNPTNLPVAEPFAFESQINTDTYPVDLSSKSPDESSQPPTESEDDNISNEIVPLLTLSNKTNQSETDQNRLQKSSWTSAKDPINIKKEVRTPPPQTKRRRAKNSSSSNEKKSLSISSLRQMTMTQLFDPIESPAKMTPVKNEPKTPTEDTMMFMPESLVGLAQQMSDNDSNQLSPKTSDIQSFKRKSILSPTINDNIPEEMSTDEEDNFQNEAILESPYAGIETEELLYACSMCRNYWLGLPLELRHKEGLTCRHRQRPVARTPEHFWSLGIPSTQTCIERGYGGVLPPDKPIERPRRPRRKHQRMLQDQQKDETDDAEED